MLFAFSVYSNTQNITTRFIDKYNALTISLSNEYKIPASVILSISIWESGSGTSKLSRTKHNYFGVKQGKHYRSYENDSISFRHFCEFTSKRKYYSKLINNNVTDYNIWVHNIQRGGYSQTKNWGKHIVDMIKIYNLNKIDNQYVFID